MLVSTIIGTAKNYTVWHFGISRNPGNEFGRQITRQQM